ncbi:SDR family NAD(P)-dependent oxidoreductase [Leptolyngbya sp. Heron Island J]|uniref:SDR family NAD(P)-dependent oxidoreductase n=1 Tax=Leptolyngbya sp. Heron Island J TaxID=1385935 RepID=UPI001377F7EA|nr:SDR family NAD(P)-dependent oxidoreductase [Leptolyngbya sp. Heron Island J]
MINKNDSKRSERHNIKAGSPSDGPSNPARRRILATGLTGLGAAAVTVAGPTILGTDAADAQPSDVQPSLDAESKKELSGKTAFITGGARGIGLASGEALAAKGANIALFDIAEPNIPNVQYPLASERDLSQAKARIEALGVRCLTFKGDVRDLEAQKRAVERTVDEFGSLDIVVANAGVSQAGMIEEFSSDDISTVFEINVGGVIKTTQAAAPFMQRQNGGRIIYISSALGRMGNELFPIYTPTKWAVIGFAKSAAVTYGKSNILCNVVAPGLVDTPLADNLTVLRTLMPGTSNPTFDAVAEAGLAGSPLNVAHLEVEDVAYAVAFFAGEGTSKVSGEVFDVSYGSLSRSIA